jgi:hypothetical protein
MDMNAPRNAIFSLAPLVLLGCETVEAADSNTPDISALEQQIAELNETIEQLQQRAVDNSTAIAFIETDYAPTSTLTNVVTTQQLEHAGYITQEVLSEYVPSRQLNDVLSHYVTNGHFGMVQADIMANEHAIGEVDDLVNQVRVRMIGTSDRVKILEQSGFVTLFQLSSKGYLSEKDLDSRGYVTLRELESKNYLTPTEMESREYVTSSWVDQQAFISPDDFVTLGVATQDWVNSSDFATTFWVHEQGFEPNLTGLSDYLRVEDAQRALVIEGANLFVQSGSGYTDDDEVYTGLGNVIIGYDEASSNPDKSGSHNLVVGPQHNYSSYGGVVTGFNNSIAAPYSTVMGGAGNRSNGAYSSISGGQGNTTDHNHSTVSGGENYSTGSDFDLLP